MYTLNHVERWYFVATIFVISFFELNAGSFRFFCFFRFFLLCDKLQTTKSLLNLLLPKSYLSEEKKISSTSQRGEVVSWMLFVCYFPKVYIRFLFSYSKNTRVIDATKIQSSFSLYWYGQKSESESSLPEKPLDHIYSGFLFCLFENTLKIWQFYRNQRCIC